MLMTRETRPAIRSLQGWAISVLQEAGATRECEEHGWMQDLADPHARERVFAIARKHSPAGISSERQPSQSRRCWVASATPARSVHLWTEPDIGARRIV